MARYPARMRQAKILLLLVFMASPAFGGNDASPKTAANTANLEFRAAAFDVYRQRYLSSLIQLLQMRNDPRLIFGDKDSQANYPYQRGDFADVSPFITADRLAHDPPSKNEIDGVVVDLYLAVGLPEAAERVLRGMNATRSAAAQQGWLKLARYYYRHGQLTDARRALGRLQDLPPQSALQAEKNSLSALLSLAEKKNGDAISALGSGNEGDALDHYNLGMALLNKGDIQQIHFSYLSSISIHYL